MGRAIVCLTFDFDAISGWIARGMTSPGPISRGEFGPHVGVPRILDLLGRYDIAASWFIPGHTLETYPEACRRIADAGHEIGHHGWTHRPPATLTRDQEEAELVRANEAIRKLTGRSARGYRSPSWDLSPHSVELLLKHGFVYDSSMMADDYVPYRVRRGDVIELEAPAVFGPATRLIEMPVSWTLDDYPHFEFIRTPTWVLARQHERERRAAELDRRFPLSRREPRLGRDHLYVSSVRDRPRAPHGHARQAHPHAERPRRGFHDARESRGDAEPIDRRRRLRARH